jgi:hypothetical protein
MAESKENTAVEIVKESGGDGGELNSPPQSCHIPSLLIQLLDQLTAMGETAAQMKKAIKYEILSNPLLHINNRANYPL